MGGDDRFGLMHGTGQKLWSRAKKVIPGGNQLLSKRAEMYLPNLWPAYYSKAEGYTVWDLDGREYKDFATMGIGACALGYADPDVNAKVKEAVDLGSMSTLNCREEVDLADMLVSLHPWSGMARFSRSGGEICSIAVRTARAATQKDKVLFCGYHGWHDWYLSSNIDDPSNLDQQLLTGLSSVGVPSHLAGSAIPFQYNDLEGFKRLIEIHRSEIAAVFMEPVRGKLPAAGFLEGIREITESEGIILIFDEITSGFRVNIGGVHRTYNVDPDLAVFGKALGNGIPISAMIGNEKTMSAIQNTFVSSTFWTERLGFVAGLETLRKFKAYDVHKSLIMSGQRINDSWTRASEKHGIDINVSGLEPLTHLDFVSENASVLQTLYTQEMLQRGFLAGSSAYATFAYDDAVLQDFDAACDSVFGTIRAAIDSNSLEQYLISDIKHSGFQRLT